MATAPSAAEKSTVPYAFALWIWTVLAAVAVGLVAGYRFGNGDELDGWWFLWGAVAGALSTLPAWTLYWLGSQILRNVTALRRDVAAMAAKVSAPQAPLS